MTVSDGGGSSDSLSEVSGDEECFMTRTLLKTAYPVALTRRPRIRQGTIAAIPCSAKQGEPMCDQAFWIVEIIRLTANHITI